MRGLWLAALVSTLAVLFPSFAAPNIPAAATGPAATPRRPAPKSAAPAVVPSIHLVKARDTLTAIASRYHVTVPALASANRLASADVRLRVGQRLVIPTSVAAGARARRTAALARTAPGERVAAGERMPPAGRIAPVERLAPVGRIAPVGVAAQRPPWSPKTLVLTLPDFSDLAPLFGWPVDGQVSSKFGRRRMGWHKGIDIKADLGMPVAASAPGKVVTSGYETRYGRVIKIEHFNGFMTVYAHNDQNLVEAGERVAVGQLIAAVGRTGRATAHHVHFEIRQAGLAYNPLYMLPLPPRATLIEETDEEDHDDTDD